MSDVGFRESTKPLLRQHQLDEMTDEKARLESTLKAPPHIQGTIQSRGDMVNQLRKLQNQIESQTPHAYQGPELDNAVKREQELREEILQGMPTQAEMRRNPAGAVDKHMAWEARNKIKLKEWKNIRLRLHASDQIPGILRDARDVANFEQFRPGSHSHELNMHNEQIEAKSYHLPPPGAGATVVMTDEQEAVLKRHAPDLLLRMAILSNEQRAEVLSLADKLADTDPEPEQEQPKRRGPSEWNLLQKRAREAGIEVHGKTRDQIEGELEALQSTEA